MKKLFILLLGLIVFLAIACQDHTSNPTSQPKYPTQTGNQWEYQTSISFEYYDTLGNIDSVETIDLGNTIVRIESENDTVNGISNLVLFSSYEVATPDSAQRSWYSNADSGLYVIAYSGAGKAQPVLPKINSLNHLVRLTLMNCMNMLPNLSPIINTIMSDSILFYDPPRKALAYPLSTNVRWIELVYPFYRERYVDELKSVQVPAGVYNCYTIKSDWDLDIEFTDYMNLTNGLISRILFADSLGISTIDNPDILLYARFKSNSQLISKSF